ncbi:MAG: DUF2065 domain-containing protein [Gammaproteobacteria bacterium]|nr:DUF2065 domain-containing protein [Gammaproteobacteria bacterium]
MWNDLLAALALLFVIEGVLPFALPASARRWFAAASQLDDATLRFAGLTSMCIGLIILYFAR